MDRRGEAARVEHELGLLFAFPGFVRRALMHLVDLGNRLGMLPKSYIENDPMFASAFFANKAGRGHFRPRRSSNSSMALS